MSAEFIVSKKAPAAVGHYSHAVKHGGIVYLSGQIAINPVTGKLEGSDIKTQTKRVILNLKAVLEDSGSSIDKALKVCVYLKDMKDFQKFNEVYSEYFARKPARSAFQVAALPKDALVEIDVIAEG